MNYVVQVSMSAQHQTLGIASSPLAGLLKGIRHIKSHCRFDVVGGRLWHMDDNYTVQVLDSEGREIYKRRWHSTAFLCRFFGKKILAAYARWQAEWVNNGEGI